MRLSIDKAGLAKALAHVASVVERRNTIPILSNVLLSARNNELKLTATDLDMELVETVPARAKGEGATTVPAHMFYDIVRKLPEGNDIELAKDGEQGRLVITSGPAQFSLQTLPADDFPALSVDDLGHSFPLSASDLKRLIEKTRFAISTEETRYYLNGIYLHATETVGQADAARGRDRRAQAGPGRAAASLRRQGHAGGDRAAQDRARARQAGRGRRRRGAHRAVAVEDPRLDRRASILTSKLIDGTFPDYERVIPQGNDKRMEVDNAAFAQAVDRVSTLSSDKGRAVKLTITDGKLTLSVNNPESGSATEELRRRLRLRSARDRLQRALSARHRRATRKRHGGVPARRSGLPHHGARRQGSVGPLRAHADAGMRASRTRAG